MPSIEEFYNHFKKINECNNVENEPNFNTSTSNSLLNTPINEHEIAKCIDNLKNDKAASPNDKIINEYIKCTKCLMIPLYYKLFNAVFDTGFLPHSWLEGFIVPIFKNKGDPKDVNNYRPITILSCLGKLFTSILNMRLSEFLEKNNIINENQAGFRKGFSCADHIFTLHALIEIMKNSKRKLFCCFIDFTQAFDKVWRVGLWQKLLHNAIDGKFFSVIYNMYQHIKSSIQLNSKTSESFPSEIGVRQGENLSPLLFSLFLNDLHLYLNNRGAKGIELFMKDDASLWLKLLVMLYADDTVIVADTADDFQHSLDLFNDYCNNWHLNVNISKTKVVVFGTRGIYKKQFKLGPQTIENTQEYTYLGVTFSNNGSFLKARKHISQQANKALHMLYTKAKHADLPIDLIIKLFDHTIMPILTYCSDIFGFENTDILERIHTNFLRRITKVRRSTPISFIYGELGRYPINITIQSKMISFWLRLITGNKNKISFALYTYMLANSTIKFKWIETIKNILNCTGRPDLWLNQEHIKTTHIKKHIKQILIDQYKQSWTASLQNSNKGKIYYSFKTVLACEEYMYIHKLGKKQVIDLFQFRTANHNLTIETGRYDGTLLQDRVCPFCSSNSVGDEFHYLFYCRHFDNDRTRLIGTYIVSHHVANLKILSSTDTNFLKQLCKFINKIASTFKENTIS